MGVQDSGKRSILYLIDGTYAVFRSFYAIARLSAPDGTPTNGVFGFLSTVRKLIREQNPDHLGVAFDLEGPTHRDELFAEYKANRVEPPPDLVPQFALAMEATRVMGWPALSAPGFEADDVLATLARQGREQGVDVVLVTSDKDLYQLVGEGVVVRNPAKDDRVLDSAGVEEVFGAPPERVTDVLALMGDAVDNVPGVPGVGEKTAKQFIKRYGDLEAVLSRAETFRRAWDARERAAVALDHDDSRRLAEALADLRGPARELAELERRLGGDTGLDLSVRFSAAAELSPEAPARVVGKALAELEKKTQPKIWLSVAEHVADARFSLELVTVRVDAPVTLDLETMHPRRADREAAVALFRRLGFRRLVEEFQADESQPHTGPDVPGPAAEAVTVGQPAAGAGEPATAGSRLAVELLDTPEALARAVRRLRDEPLVAVDTETDSLDPRGARLVGVALAAGPAGGYYIPVGHRGGEQQVPWEAARPVLKDLLEDARVPKVAQNAKFDRAVLRRGGIVVEGIAFDTLIAAQLLDPDRTASHRLDDLAQRFLRERMIAYGDVAGRGAGQRTLDLVDAPTVARYAVEDAVIAWRLAAPLGETLREADLLELFETVEVPLIPVLEEMEAVGIRIDAGILHAMSARMDEELGTLEREIHRLAGRSFNINSPQQLRALLFDELKLQPTGRRTQKTRVHSTGQEVLEELAAVHPLPARVLEHRERTKLKSTYVDALPRLVSSTDGRVHTQFHQLGAATGRLSSSDPNLQNIPIRTETGRMIRAAFVPQAGWKFVSADYSQMELRILAHLADDPQLIESFSRGEDIHRATAALVAGIPLEQVTPALRAAAKAVNFGIVYGMSEYRLAREQSMSVEEARLFIGRYFARHPRVREFIDASMRQVQQTGEVRTLYGRVRRFPDLVGGGSRLNRPAREALLRQAVNAVVQGTGADIVKRAMVDVARRMKERGLAARLLLQVHDELLFEAPVDEAPVLSPLVRKAMESAANLSAPLKVDLSVADNWAEAH